MKDIVGVKFRKPGKIYFFDANGLKIDKFLKISILLKQYRIIRYLSLQFSQSILYHKILL